MADFPLTRQVRDPESTRRMVAQLRRRTLVVLFWRGALPAVLGVGMVGVLGWAGYRTFSDNAPVAQSAGDIRMLGPEFRGRDKKGLPYVVTADSAVRDPLHINRSNLTEPRLVMDSAAHGKIHVKAHNGVYDETSKLLDLWGDVTADTETNEHFQSPTAHVDTNNNIVVGDSQVQASNISGATQASSYRIDEKSGHVVLTGGVHTHLIPHAAANAAPKPKE